MQNSVRNGLLAALMMALITTGCSTLNMDKRDSMESGLTTFSHGEVATTAKASLKSTWAAAQKATKELGMTIERLDYAPPTAILSARTQTGKVMEVHLKKAGFGSTSINIFMGPKGDELLQRQFLAKMENML